MLRKLLIPALLFTFLGLSISGCTPVYINKAATEMNGKCTDACGCRHTSYSDYYLMH